MCVFSLSSSYCTRQGLVDASRWKAGAVEGSPCLFLFFRELQCAACCLVSKIVGSVYFVQRTGLVPITPLDQELKSISKCVEVIRFLKILIVGFLFGKTTKISN